MGYSDLLASGHLKSGCKAGTFDLLGFFINALWMVCFYGGKCLHGLLSG